MDPTLSDKLNQVKLLMTKSTSDKDAQQQRVVALEQEVHTVNIELEELEPKIPPLTFIERFLQLFFGKSKNTILETNTNTTAFELKKMEATAKISQLATAKNELKRYKIENEQRTKEFEYIGSLQARTTTIHENISKYIQTYPQRETYLGNIPTQDSTLNILTSLKLFIEAKDKIEAWGNVIHTINKNPNHTKNSDSLLQKSLHELKTIYPIYKYEQAFNKRKSQQAASNIKDNSITHTIAALLGFFSFTAASKDSRENIAAPVSTDQKRPDATKK